MPTPKEYQEMLSVPCPWCGEALVLRTGKYGEFIACAEWCGYRKSIRGRSEYPPPKSEPKLCPHKMCDGSSLIPFKNKEGKVIPYTWLHCGCHPVYGNKPELEHWWDMILEDYDFPMSQTFRAWTYQDCGVQDPGYVPLEPLRLQEMKSQPQPGWSKRQWEKVEQLRLAFLHYQEKFIELSKAKKKDGF